MREPRHKPLRWVGRSKEELKEFPEEVQDVMGFALFQAEIGGKHPSAKPLRGYKGAGVLEVVEDFDTDTYRTVYTVRFSGAVYVLHAFQKKAKHGIETPKHTLDLIDQRLKEAQRLHDEEFGPKNRKRRSR
jgi:phage-related protein